MRIKYGPHPLFLARSGLPAERAETDEARDAALFVVPHVRLPFPEFGRIAAYGGEVVPRLRLAYDVAQRCGAEGGQFGVGKGRGRELGDGEWPYVREEDVDELGGCGGCLY